MQKLIRILKPIVFIICVLPTIYCLIELIFFFVDLAHKGCLNGFINSWPYIFHPKDHPFTWPLFGFICIAISTNLLDVVQKTRNSIVGFIVFLFGVFFLWTMIDSKLAESIFMGLRIWGIPILIFGVPFLNSFTAAAKGEPIPDYSWGDDDYDNYDYTDTYNEEPVRYNNQRGYEDLERQRQDFYQDQMRYEQETRQENSRRQSEETRRKMQQIREEQARREQERLQRRHTIAYARPSGTYMNIYNIDNQIIFSVPGFEAQCTSNTVTVSYYINKNDGLIYHKLYDNHGRCLRSWK